jgi:hypothetical protein
MKNKKLLIYLFIAVAMMIVAVINFVLAKGHWATAELQHQVLPITSAFSIQTQWIIFLLVLLAVLFMFFYQLNKTRKRRGHNKQPNRF